MQQLFNKDLSTGTLNDMSSEHGMEYWAVITSTKLSVHDVPTNIWSISAHYCLSGAASEHYLDEDSTLYLANTYQVMYKQDVINTSISFRAMSYTYIKNGNTVYGSIGSRSKRSCYILAAWCGKDGHVDTSTTELRPGQVMYYFQHNYTMTGNTKSYILCLLNGTNITNVIILNHARCGALICMNHLAQHHSYQYKEYTHSLLQQVQS